MVCPTCGNPLREGSHFCSACGAPASVAERVATAPTGKPGGAASPGPEPKPSTEAGAAPGRSSTRWILVAAASAAVLVAVFSVVLVTGGGSGETASTTTTEPPVAIAPATSAPAAGVQASVPDTGPAPVDREEEARQEIEALVVDGEQRVDGGMLERWIPQVSSKRPGLEADGIVYDYEAILDHFSGLRQRFGDLILVNSSDFTSFEQDGWYVALAPQAFGSSDQALGWCSGQGMNDRNLCFAKFVSRSTPYSNATTEYP